MTIERTAVGGRPATVAYLNDEFQPVAAELATLLKVTYDTGEVVFFSTAVPEGFADDNGKAVEG